MIDAWRDAIATAGDAAPRFKLHAGDVVVVDNYRMMHGREAYADLDRLMWRVWVWTTASFGVPGGPPHTLFSREGGSPGVWGVRGVGGGGAAPRAKPASSDGLSPAGRAWWSQPGVAGCPPSP